VVLNNRRDSHPTLGVKLIHYPRPDIKSGQYTEYMPPRSTNIRRVYVDDSKNPGTLWIGSNHGASIVKVEPLE
jgi:hypothetical protein